MAEHAGTVIEVSGLTLDIGKKRVLDGVSFDLKKGGVYAVVGHNGAGKSTLIRTLLGLEPKYTGIIRLFGSEELSSGRTRVGAMIPVDKLPPKITGERYLKELCMLCGCDPETEISRVAALTGSTEFLRQRIGGYSFGMKQRLSLAGAMTGSPEIVFLDEPFKGLDPEAAGQLQFTISSLTRSGVTVVVTDHILGMLLDLGCEFLVMNGGRLTHRLTCADLSRVQLPVKRFTLGTGGMTSELFAANYPEYCGIVRGGYVDVIEPPGKEVPDGLIAGCTDVTRAAADSEEMLIWYISGKDGL